MNCLSLLVTEKGPEDGVSEPRHRRQEVSGAGELMVVDPGELASEVPLQERDPLTSASATAEYSRRRITVR